MERKIKSINLRVEEYNNRPEAYKKHEKKIKDYEAKLGKLNRESPWITDEEKKPLIDALEETT